MDDDAPTFGLDATEAAATTGEDLDFSIEVRDNIGVDAAWVVYWYGNGTASGLDLDPSGGDLWEATITVQDTMDPLRYQVTARDAARNEATTVIRIVDIVDNDPPVVVEDLSDPVATTGDVFHARIRVRDNVGIGSVSPLSPWTPVDIDESGNGVYEFGIPIVPDQTGDIHVSVTETDLAGNEVEYELTSRQVLDDDAPVLTYHGVEGKAYKGTEVVIICEAGDNIGVESMHCEYWTGDGGVQNETMGSLRIGIDVPRRPDGDLHVRFTAVDVAGNWAVTEEHTIVLTNAPPEIGSLPYWSVREGDNAEYDLAPHIVDPNDDAFTVECSHGDVIVDGLLLRVRHDTPVADYTVTLTVSDGEDDDEASLRIHVVNVNDPPIIIGLFPVNGTRVKEGRKVVLTVVTEDEAGDPTTVTWNDDDRVLCTGSPMEVSFKPGKYTITVVVDDGTEQVEDSLVIIVRKEEESPGFGSCLVAIAILLAIIVAGTRRER